MNQALLDMMDPSSICVGVHSASRDGVIELLGRRLEDSGIVKPSFIGAVIERERKMPTGLPLGTINVAVPHTDPDHVLKSGIALATLADPVEFGSMDDPNEQLPVRIVFAMALKKREAQLDMLQSIARVIQDPAILDSLIAARTVEQIMAAIGANGSDR